MKSILLSIKPEWLVKILNGEKTIEIRKKFPKDYVGWVYLYCSKGKPYLLNKLTRDICFWEEKQITADDMLNGKVVARFWCDKAERIWKTTTGVWLYETEMSNKLYEKSCLSDIELDRYFKPNALGFRYTYGRAIHISKIEIFDRPKELSEFHTVNKYGIPQYQFGNGTCDYRTLTKAPQNYCYVEGEPR